MKYRFKSFYINGMNTEVQEAISDARLIQDMIGERVDLGYNPKDGFFADLFEAFIGTYEPTNIAISLKNTIETGLNDFDVVRIFCHSQGGIITSNLISLLPYDVRGQIEVYCFASAQDKEPGGCGWYEYFWNTEDILKKLYIGKYDEGFWGPQYLRESGDGANAVDEHNLQKSYLNKINEFENFEKSKFYKLISRN